MTPTLPEALARVERLRELLCPSRGRFDQRMGHAVRQEHRDDAAALDTIVAEVQRLREALPKLEEVRDTEWIAGVEVDQCPACTHARERGWHAKDCWIARLAALLETP